MASQSAWAPSPPEKKLSVGDALPLRASALVDVVRRNGTARKTVVAATNGQAGRFICIVVSRSCWFFDGPGRSPGRSRAAGAPRDEAPRPPCPPPLTYGDDG